MYGVVLVSHNGLSQAILDTAKMIMGENEYIKDDVVQVVELIEGMSPDSLVDETVKATLRVMKNGGVIILTDLFGGSTTNFLASRIIDKFREKGININNDVYIISGFNLAMVISAITNNSQEARAADVIDIVINDAISNIRNVSDLIKGRQGI